MWIEWNKSLEEALEDLRVELGQAIGQGRPLSYADLAFRISSCGKSISPSSIRKWCGKAGGVTRIESDPAKALLAYLRQLSNRQSSSISDSAQKIISLFNELP